MKKNGQFETVFGQLKAEIGLLSMLYNKENYMELRILNC